MQEAIVQKNKQSIRQKALQRRADLSVIERIEKSLALAKWAEQLQLTKGAMVAGYWPIRDEIDPRPVMDLLAKQGAQLCLPVVKRHELIFRVLTRGHALEPAGFGTMGPGTLAAVADPACLLVPLAAFDRVGNRLGYGKGFYDRALSQLEKNEKRLCIGLAFSCQEVEEVPVEAHDRPLDGVITEQGFIDFRGKGNTG